MSQNLSDTPDALYETPVESLGLSEAAIKAVKRTGITTVGDCVDFFARLNGAMIDAPFGFFEVMETQVLPKLEEHGCWPPDACESD